MLIIFIDAVKTLKVLMLNNGLKVPLNQEMNTTFTQLSRSNSNNQSSNNSRDDVDNFSKVKVNVVGDWSKKKGPIVSFSVRSDPEKKINKSPPPNPDYEKPRRLKSFNIYLTDDDNVESVNEYNDTLPDKVEGTYKYDFNIIDIHNLIMKRFDQQKKQDIKILKEQLNNEHAKMKDRQNMVERKTSLRIVDKLKESI